MARRMNGILAVALVFLTFVQAFAVLAQTKKPAEAAGTYASVLPAAEGGDPEAQTKIALLLRGGRKGASKDPAKAREWLEKAAASKYVPGMYQLGLLMSSTDRPASKNWLEKAVDGGSGPAAFFLGNTMFIDGNKEEAMEWYRTGVKLGNAPCMWRLAKNLQATTPLGSPEIESLFQEGARKGHPPSMARFGEYLLLDNNSDKYVEAWAWITLAINRSEGVDKEDFMKVRDDQMTLTIQPDMRAEGEKRAGELAGEIPLWKDE